MFERIFTLLTELWDSVSPWVIVPQYERHVVLRFGAYHRELASGYHWKWPVIESLFSCSVVYTTSSLANQTLETSDGKTVTLSAAVRHKVNNPKVYLLETSDTDQAVEDMISVAIAEAVNLATWEEVRGEDFWKGITKKATEESRQWGVRVLRVGYQNLARIRAIRLLMDQQDFSEAE